MSKSPTDNGKKLSALQAELRDLETELTERKRPEEESGLQNTALELRLTKVSSELKALKEELRREKEGRRAERSKIAELDVQLLRQRGVLDSLQEELESLGYAISHDLMAPLRHVVGFSSVLLEDYREGLDAAGQNYLDCIVRAGRKMEVLIEALLGLSRITRQELRPVSIDLSKMAGDCAAALQQAAPGRRVAVTIAGGLAARADAALLKAALEKLFENAWKYTRHKEEATVEFGSLREGEGTVFYLRDNGAGFDMRYAQKLFGPFQRMHRESDFEGTGIGLATVQRIIHRHGGKIWADATVDGGATFYFTLPE